MHSGCKLASFQSKIKLQYNCEKSLLLSFSVINNTSKKYRIIAILSDANNSEKSICNTYYDTFTRCVNNAICR